MGNLVGGTPATGGTVVNVNDPADIRWAPGFRHPTVHPTIGLNGLGFYPGAYQSLATTTVASSIHSIGQAGIEPAGFAACSSGQPSISTAVSLSTGANGNAGLCFGSPYPDIVWDGVTSTAKQQTDVLNNRVLPNVPCYAPSTGIKTGLWQYSGTFWVDSQVNQIGGAAYGWTLLVYSQPYLAMNYDGCIGLTASSWSSVNSGGGGVTANTGTSAMTTALGTAYPFTIAKTGFSGATSSFRVTFGTVIDATYTSTTRHFNEQLSLFFANGSSVASRPFRILDARFRQM